MLGVSVIVCCYNSALLIKDTLVNLSKLSCSEFEIEIILVDNASNDGTAEIAKCLWNSFDTSIPILIISEIRQGLSYARQTGVLNASFNYIIFCDDDNWLAPDYASKAIEFMESHPEVGCLGGLNKGVLEISEPVWWKEKANEYAVGKQGIVSGDITSRGFIWGAGMVIRKIILLKLFSAGFIPLLHDRKGNALASGGDSEYCKWVILLGYKLYYLESLHLNHYISSSRINEAYIVKLIHGHNQAAKILAWYNFFIQNQLIYKSRTLLSSVILDFRLWLLFIFKRDQKIKALLQMKIGGVIKMHSVIFNICKIYNQCLVNKV